MRLAPTTGGNSIFDHQQELFNRFQRLYGTLWELGRVDLPTKEVARLRNARLVDCKL